MGRLVKKFIPVLRRLSTGDSLGLTAAEAYALRGVKRYALDIVQVNFSEFGTNTGYKKYSTDILSVALGEFGARSLSGTIPLYRADGLLVGFGENPTVVKTNVATVVWATNIPAFNLIVGVPVDIDLDQYCTGEQWMDLLAGALPAGLALDKAARRLTGSPTTLGSSSFTLRAFDTPQNAVADWQARISGAGVVWHHGFEFANEVNNFRWTNGYGNGNDPLAVGSPVAPFVRRITTDGTAKTPGGQPCCMELLHVTGSNAGTYWHRPMAPLVGSGNGRGVNDPATNGTLTVRPYAPTDGGNQIRGFPNVGIYGNSQYHGINGTYDGTEFYMQVRLKMDPRRQEGALNRATNSGKTFYFTRMDGSNTDQELVFESYRSVGGSRPNGGDNAVSVYRGSGYVLLNQDIGADVQPGSDFKPAYWTYPYPTAEWVTLLFRVVEGTMTGGLGSQTARLDSTFEVWAARYGETSYTKIWSQLFRGNFDGFWGHNGVIAAIYQNNASMSEFYHRYDQIIFSKNPIPCPQVW